MAPVTDEGADIPPRHGCRCEFTMAFQPVVDLERRAVVSYEALVRGRNGEGAAHVLSLVHTDHRYAFDQACRIKAVAIGTRLGVGTATRLGINCLPNSLCRPDA